PSGSPLRHLINHHCHKRTARITSVVVGKARGSTSGSLDMRSSPFNWLAVVAVPLLFLASGPLAAEDWPQFRGPNCTGVSSSKKALPTEFSPTKNVRWSAVLGDGIGSPVVAAGRVFSTGMSAPKGKEPKLVVYAFEAATGKKLW